MSASSVLLVAASIVATDGTLTTIDAGKAQHLERGDQGLAFYELMVDGNSQRIEVGPIVVATVSESTASVLSQPGVALRPGYRVEFHLPPERLKRLASSSTRVKQPLKLPASVPAEPPPAASAVQSPTPASAEPPPTPRSSTPPLTAEPAPPLVRRNALAIAAGRYAIGLDPSEAQFHNQTPRHVVPLADFAIDRYLVGRGRSLLKGGSPATGLTFAEAQDRCGLFGLRLPTEQEWEIAAQTDGFHVLPGFFEWTSSWYQGYPGNSRSEEGYGEISKVLRGSEDGSIEGVYARQFMNPAQQNPRVGFRCVEDLP